MSGIPLATAQAQLDLWIAADAAVAASQSYEIAGRKLTRADAADITAKIEYWSSKVALASAQSSGRGRARTIRVA